MSQQFTPNNPLPQEAKLPAEIARFSPEVEAEIDRHLAKYPVKRSAILPLMFIVQRERGYLDPPGVAYLADRLGVRITDIWEVATFYSMINTKPVGKYHLQICRTLSCKIMGAGTITEHCAKKLGIKPGETTEDGMFSLSEVECLGSCGTAPMMQIGFDYHENLSTEKVDEILDSCSRGEYRYGVKS
ncbi:MAG TPA: NADH-quinone oxidoreductase subunit NuoE [Pyrinomonadaceae bacterium]|nr:NADH-quinone oxidoreductase subunit NuoE [Pyrinomonadaceae bacterium]